MTLEAAANLAFGKPQRENRPRQGAQAGEPGGGKRGACLPEP